MDPKKSKVTKKEMNKWEKSSRTKRQLNLAKKLNIKCNRDIKFGETHNPPTSTQPFWVCNRWISLGCTHVFYDGYFNTIQSNSGQRTRRGV